MSGYLALLHPPAPGASSWGVTFPDLPGLASDADSLEAAALAAREALSGHLVALRDDGDPVPAPRTWADLQHELAVADDLRAGALLHYIVPRRVPGERVRVNVMIDKGLLREADEAADARGLSRSGLVEQALLRSLAEGA